MLQLSTGFKTKLLGGIAFVDQFAGGAIHVYNGGRPDSADIAADESTRLGIIGLSGLPGALRFVQAGAFVFNSVEDAWGLVVERGGNAVWFRLLAAGDDGDNSTTAARIDGDIGTIDAPKEMVFADTALVAGTAVPIDSFVFSLT